MLKRLEGWSTMSVKTIDTSISVFRYIRPKQVDWKLTIHDRVENEIQLLRAKTRRFRLFTIRNK